MNTLLRVVTGITIFLVGVGIILCAHLFIDVINKRNSKWKEVEVKLLKEQSNLEVLRKSASYSTNEEFKKYMLKTKDIDELFKRGRIVIIVEDK